MTRVLVVDDEPSYRDYLGRYLAREGYEVRVAVSGGEAIEIGTRFHPDVLVADWMLKNHVHGLHVSEALSAVDPGLATILITGFPSRDLKAAAERARVLEFVEKPFELDTIRAAVARGARLAGRPADPPLIGRAASGRRQTLGVVETDAEGRVVHASPAACELARAARLPEDEPSWSAWFEPGAAPDAAAAESSWVEATPRGGRGAWSVRSQRPHPSRTRLWLVRSHSERADVALTEMLLGVEEPLAERWPFAGRVLVVDDDELFRHVAVAILESAGATCYAAETDVEALRLLNHDEGIQVVLVDYEIPGCDVGAFIDQARRLRPDLQMVGNSAFERSEEFAKFGVTAFLRKPWRPRDLIDLIDET